MSEETSLVPKPEDRSDNPTEFLVQSIEEDGGQISWFQTGAKRKWVSNLDLTNDDTKAQIVSCMMAADEQMEARINTWIPVKHWFGHDVTLTNRETGEVRDAKRLVLITPEGTTISTCSAPFVNGWGFVLQVYGTGPYEPVIEVKPYKVPAKVGHYYQFRVQRNGKPATVEKPAPATPQPKVKVRTKDNPAGD